MPENLSKNAMLWRAIIEALNNFWMDNSVLPEVTTARLVELSGECSRLAHHMIVKSSGLTRDAQLRNEAEAGEQKSPCCLPTQHNWKEEYYGYKCERCQMFIPYGSEPWLPTLE